MSRRKQANPAKLGESGDTPTTTAAHGDAAAATDTLAIYHEPESAQKEDNHEISGNGAAAAQTRSATEEDKPGAEWTGNDLSNHHDINDDIDDDDDDDYNSLLNGQGSSPSSSSDQEASPTSSRSSLSDGDGEVAFTLGATATTPYECSICKKAFARSSLLSKHVQTHPEQLQFSCPYCRRLFKHKRSRDRHTKLHTGDKKYKCLHCDSAFARSDHLKIHMKTHDNKKPHQCDLCNRGYNTAAALASHQQHHSKQEQLRCGSSASRSSAPSTPSPGNFRCPQCPETYDKAETLQNHLSTSHNKTISQSPVTDGNFMLKSPLELPKIACMYCGKDFLSMNHMYQHIHTEHRAIFNNMSYSPNAVEDLSPKTQQQQQQLPRSSGSPTYACDRCTMRFDSPLVLQEHVENVHWAPVNIYKEFTDKSPSGALQTAQSKPTDLSRKRRADTEASHELPAARPEKKKHSSPSMLSPYETNDKPCICSYCYTQMPNFKMFLLHMESHVNASSGSNSASLLGCLQCPLCGDPARSALELGRHIFGHAIANVTAFCCHACKKPFDKVDQLQKHLAETHSRTIFKCTLCNEILESQLNLQMHMSSKHSAECKHFRCNLCADQVFHDRLTAELHVNMKHSLQAPLAAAAAVNSRVFPLPRYPDISEQQFQSQQQPKQQQRIDYPLFQCPFCQKIFKDEYMQYVHVLKEHNDMRELENYYKSGTPPEKLNKQLEIKTAQQSYSCEICNRNDIASDAELAAHKKLHHAKSKGVCTVSLQCAYCNEHCKSRSDLEHHMKSHQVTCGKSKHKCNICDEIFSSGSTLAEHKLSHCKIVAGNSCTQCKTQLVDEPTFYNHQLQHSNHSNSSSGGAKGSMHFSLPANCIICCQTLQTDVEIKLHAKFHLRHLQKEFMCSMCSKICDLSQKNVETSVCLDCAAHASNGNVYQTEKNIFACLKCPQTCDSEEAMQTHAADHIINEEVNIECHLCRNVLPSPSKLQIHLIEHNFMGMGQYRCYVCSSVFTTAAGLGSHIVGHGPNHRPYECTTNECKMKFYFETELENHKFAHLHVKSYAKNGAELPYDKYIECKHCALSMPECAYYAEHVRTCNPLNNGRQSRCKTKCEPERNSNHDANANHSYEKAESTSFNVKLEAGDNEHAESAFQANQRVEIKSEND